MIVVTPLNIRLGDFTGSVVDFLIISAVLFLVVVKLMGALCISGWSAVPAAPNTKICPECLETIPLAAKRCKACTSVQPA